MRLLKGLLYFFVFAVTLFIGFIAFAPWGDMLQLSLVYARKVASTSSVYVTYGDIQISGLFPEFYISDMDVETPFARISVTGITLEPNFLESMLSVRPVCGVSYKNAVIKAVYGKELSLIDGSLNINADTSSIHVDDISVEGDVTLHGSVHLDIKRQKVIESTISFKVPADLDALLKNPMLSKFVTQGADGEWRIRYGE